ncbi:TetR/AcrR family transcriptional regulator [Oenococcus alcoholitolerans]|uniref:HTH tetR-type domain-containing protein n=1 Tax=Oenococcus alcoholitolerans TaxID=931074 RepID=A0ABR4XRZ8_9LACO|nr:hypothetical protein Q757_03330 [Oenococcus alcoholitolerans]
MNTKDKILEAALGLFLSGGYDGVSISDIVKAANVSKGGLYNYFSSKEDLFYQAVYHSYDRLGAFDVKKFSEKDFQDFKSFYQEFSSTYDGLLSMHGKKLSELVILWIHAIKKFPDLNARSKKFDNLIFDIFNRNIEKGQRSGELSNKLNSREIASIYILVFRSTTIDNVFPAESLETHIEPVSIRHAFDDLYYLIRKGEENALS